MREAAINSCSYSVSDAMALKKIPTGIASLDATIKGGLPSGSLVVLMGDVGAGHTEFAYTSAASLSLMHSRGQKLTEDFSIPSKICYVSITRSREDVLNELDASLPREYSEAAKSHLEFNDLSEIYFQRSSVPLSWASSAAPASFDFKIKKEKSLLEMLVSYLDANASSSVVIIDSLNELVRNFSEHTNWQDFISFLRGLQRVSKRWNGIIYALLSANIFENNKQEEIADCADGVLVFKWGEAGASQIQRTMHVRKFRALLPQLEQDNIVKFETRITSRSGFEILRVRQIMGR